ncbi:MAG: hypothetical protein QOF83_1082, partial [Solirubrobacteraceae bacterium]|nr:hypothetical protein [Solirubrobacteraceae bacterium]
IALGGGYIYWGHNPYTGAASIARATETGLGIDNTYITGLNSPCGIASYAQYLYFADGATVDRTDLTSVDPTAATEQIVLGTKSACGVAVDSLYAGTLTVLARHSLPHGIVRLTLSVSNPGVVVIGQAPGWTRAVRHVRVSVRHAGQTTVILHPTLAARLQLWKHRQVTARVRIDYAPTGGITTAKTTIVSLVRR